MRNNFSLYSMVLVSIFMGALASSGELRKTKTGQEFQRVSEDVLRKAGVKDVAACVGKDGKFGAFEEPSQKDKAGTPLIWCGDVARDKDGKVRTMNHADADAYCKSIGASLPTGYFESRNGKNGFPDQDSDHVRLAKLMGATDSEGKGYSPYVQGSTTQTVLPNLTTYEENRWNTTRWFWSSSVYPDSPWDAYVFYGRLGNAGYRYQYHASFVSVRCVVARR